MRIAEHRKAIRTQLQGALHRIEARSDALVRQSVDQIEIDAGDAGTPQAGDGAFRLLEALYAVDGTLDLRIKALNPQASTVDAAKRQRLDHGCRQCARVDLDCDFGRGHHEEGVPDQTDQIGEGVRRHDGRGAASEMNMLDFHAAADLPDDLIDLAAEGRFIYRDRVIAPSDGGVAAAVPAHRAAERDMQIERRACAVRDGCQPVGIGLRADRS
jgi:hypothetical protein